MKAKKLTQTLAQESLHFLMEIDYLVEQMANAHVPLEEGYEKLIQLVQKNLKN